jgi:hypothetical protein
MFRFDKAEFWEREDHFGQLLDILRDQGEEAAPIWERLCGQINREVLVPGDVYQRALLLDLAAAKDRPGPALPARTARTISDWALLREHFEKAAAVPASTSAAIIEACNRCSLDPIGVLTEYFERFIQPQGLNQDVLDDFMGFYHSFYGAGEEYQDHGSRMLGWLQIVEGCADEAQQAAYQKYYLEGVVPAEFRWRLAEETHKLGKLLPVVYEAVPRATEPGGPPRAMRGTLPMEAADELFALTGLRAVEGQAPLTRSLWKRLPWLLCTMGGGLIAVLVSGLYKLKAQHLAALAPFIPVVVALAESMALQAAGLTLQGLRGQIGISRDHWAKFARELLAVVILGAAAGLLVSGVSFAAAGTMALALCLGVTVAGGMIGAAVVGMAVPVLLLARRWDMRVAAGPVVRAIASALAMLIYFMVAHGLLQ